MTTTKVNIGMAISKNFNKVTLELLDEPIVHTGAEELRQGIQYRYDIIQAEIDKVLERCIKYSDK